MPFIGLDIGGTKCAATAWTEDETLVRRVEIATGGPEATLMKLFEACGELGACGRTLFGVSCGGPLDAERGVIMSPPNLPGWDDVPVCRTLEQRFGGRAFLMNDANAGALAEWRFGAARGHRHVVFLTCGTGMGAGLVLNGRLYEGASGMAGEVGRLRLAEAGPVGHGKAGSFEGFCSGGGIARAAAARAKRLGLERVCGVETDRVTARDVAKAAAAGDSAAHDVLRTAGRYLGLALAAIVDTLNPEIVVLGSLFVRCRELLEPPMLEALREEALPESLRACRVAPAELGERIGDYAALSVALYRSGRWPPR
jgi:glucokinase